jgi:hypothetical protein
MHGRVTPFLHVPSWHTKERLYFTVTIRLLTNWTVRGCPKSIRPWAGKTMLCIWEVTIPNPLQSRPLMTPKT